MLLHIDDGLTQRAVGLHQTRGQLPVEPRFESVHQWLALRLVVRQAGLGACLRQAGLLVVVEDLAEHLEHHLALLRKHVFQLAELAPAMRQAVTPN